MEEGLRILEQVKVSTGLPVLTDIHETHQAAQVAAVADVLQIPGKFAVDAHCICFRPLLGAVVCLNPLMNALQNRNALVTSVPAAFLCRQTDLLLAAARTGKVVHIKKGQFASAQAMKEQADKVRGAGNPHVMLCERGTTFGYEDLVVDPRSLARMRRLTGLPVVLDVTHCLQRPSAVVGSGGTVSGGDGSLVEYMGDMAAGCGVSGIFVEVHDSPEHAKCDAALQTRLERLEGLARRWTFLAQSYRAAPPA